MTADETRQAGEVSETENESARDDGRERAERCSRRSPPRSRRVPNHMGIGSGDNAWWSDVLENGPSSPYAGYFDIDWAPPKPEPANKVLLPVLGSPPGAHHLVAFARRAGGNEIVVVVPRLTARLTRGRNEPPVGTLWSDTGIAVNGTRYRQLFTGEFIDANTDMGLGTLPIERVLADFPVALLERVAG